MPLPPFRPAIMASLTSILRPQGARLLPGTSVPGSQCPQNLFFRPEGGRSRAMPSAYTQNFYHAVFSTKHRANLITPDLELRLFPFIGGIVRDLRCTLLAINCSPDHVHLLIRYRADLSHSEML